MYNISTRSYERRTMIKTKKIALIILSSCFITQVPLQASIKDVLTQERISTVISLTSLTGLIAVFLYALGLRKQINDLSSRIPAPQDLSEYAKRNELETEASKLWNAFKGLMENAGDQLQVSHIGAKLTLQQMLNTKVDYSVLEEATTKIDGQIKDLGGRLDKELTNFNVLRAAASDKASKKELEELEQQCTKLTATEKVLGGQIGKKQQGSEGIEVK